MSTCEGTSESTREKNSTHKVEVVGVRLEKHPNADRLSVVRVFGYQVCTGTDEWISRPAIDHEGTRLGAYIPPDSLVPISNPAFAFQAEQANELGLARIKAKKLRGVVSFGLLVPAPPGSKIGDDVADVLGVRHYEPPLREDAETKRFATGGEIAPGPDVYTVKYDLDAFRRYHGVFVPGEPVIVTEKLDGSNARYVFQGGKMHCGSRTEWKKEYPSYEHLTVESLVAKGCDELNAREIVLKRKSTPVKKNLWWYALERTPTLRTFCEANPGLVVYGEVFGRQGRLRYTDDKEEVFFAAFDILRDGKWIDAEESRDMLASSGVPVVPLVAKMPYDFETICALTDGPSLWPGAKCIREGVVVKPLLERHEHCGRVSLKSVSAAYLEKHG